MIEPRTPQPRSELALRLVLFSLLIASVGGGCRRSSGGKSGSVAQIRLSEVMASNTNFPVPDEAGNIVFHDWVEIYNPLGSAVNLEGYSLSDNLQKPRKYQFPRGTLLGSKGYLLVFLYSDRASRVNDVPAGLARVIH